MPDEMMFYDAEGAAVDPDQLEFGDHVFDADGQEYVLEGDDDDSDSENDGELVGAGVSKAFEGAYSPSDQLSASILEELSKAVTEADKAEVLSKALGQIGDLTQRLEHSEQIAKSERELRLQKEYISKAAEYNVPIAPEALGPVLMRMAETMSYDDCRVIHKALTSAGEMLFEEAGFQGQADNDDPMSRVDAFLEEAVSKSEGGISKFAATEQFFDTNPAAYDEYVRNMRS